jgi:hypothetical protein
VEIVIGVGGAGIRVAAELAPEPGSGAVTPVVLAIDTIADTRQVTPPGIKTFALGGIDFALASALVADSIRLSVNLDALDQLSRIKLNFGAMALPEIGLVSCAYHAPRLSAWFGRELTDIKRRIGDQALRIGVVGSIAGGTGTGTLMLIAPVVRETLKRSGLDGTIHGCALTASFFTHFAPSTAHLLRNERIGITHLKRGLPKSGFPYAWDSFVVARGEGRNLAPDSAVGRALKAHWQRADTKDAGGVVFTDLSDVDVPEPCPDEPVFRSERAPKVFISYAREDEKPATQLYDRLHASGYRPWIDIRDLRGGQEWELVIRQAIHDADFVVVCLSNRSMSKRGFIQREIRFALECYESIPFGQAFLVPVRLEECQPPPPLSRFQYVDLFVGEGFERLDQSIMEHWIERNARRGIPG